MKNTMTASAQSHSEDLQPRRDVPYGTMALGDAGPMAQTVCVILSVADRERLQAIAGDRNQRR